jgi:hypothetical protein
VYLDFGKKVAVYYGEVSQHTTIQVLMVSILCLSGTYRGGFPGFLAFVSETLRLYLLLGH